ncbi:MAG: GNAT family N-acetyltransferase [Trueperaceae bacterium]|nr:GNAT family N-acetyltransferase [Trueperaceae bacterium]
MSSFSLEPASIHDGDDILAMLNEIGRGENGFHNHAYNLTWKEYKAYLNHCERNSKGLSLDKGHVQQTTYWFRQDSYPLGVIKLRHELNDSLRRQGGHIGYSMRPSERGKGYGKVMLQAVLNPARALGLDKVLLTIFISNIASRKMVERCGGVLERSEGGICYYWIELTTSQL